MLHIVSYVLLESAIRPDIQSKLSRSQEAEPRVIWMTEGGRNEFIACSFMLRHWPLDIQGGGGGGGGGVCYYFYKKNNRALKFFEKNN